MFNTLISGRSSLQLLLASAALLTTVSGCATSTDDSAAPSDTESTEAVGTTSEAVTYPGGNVAQIGNFQIKSAAGNFCISAVANRPVTAACANSADQVATVYQLPNGKFQICYPNTFRIDHFQYSTSYNYDSASAVCLYKTGASTKTLDFRRTGLTVKGFADFGEFGGYNSNGAWIADPYAPSIAQEANGVLGWVGTGLKVTRNSVDKTVLLSNPLTDTANQRWSFIAK